MSRPWDHPTPHTIEITVSERDIDGMGHANNSCYVVWCERCAWEHSRSLGLTMSDYQRLNRGVAIQRASYEYAQPATAGEKLRIGTWLTGCDGRLRLERRFQILRESDQSTVLRGHWTLVGINVETGRPARLPPEFIAIYGGAVISSAP